MSAGVIGYVGRLRAVLAPDADDAALLRVYALDRDADAFAALVRRHGPRVWATCRRVVGDPHAAEDAFQATFLVLARRAAGLTPAVSLGGWLHTVAVHVSVRARTAADRRKRREVSSDAEAVAPPPPEPPDERSLVALDEEIAKLPAKLRDAVVLCELDGLSRRDAATKLGVPEGTLSSRLATARKRLADRLKGRGVTPELLAVSAAAVPAGLAEAASGLGVGTVPAPAVLALAGGTMRAMLLKGLAAGAVACGLLTVGGLAKDDPPTKPAEPPKAAKPAAPREGVIVVTSFGRKGEVTPVERFKPDGTKLDPAPVGDLTHLWQPRVSPDGTKLLAARLGPIRQGVGVFTPNQHVLLDLTKPDAAPEPFGPTVYHQSAVWSKDGKRVFGTAIAQAAVKELGETPLGELPNRDELRKPGSPIPLAAWVYDVVAKTRTPFALPDGHEVADLSSDGTTFLTTRPLWMHGYPRETFTVTATTLEPKRLTGAGFEGWRFSPDGRSVLGRTITVSESDKPPTHVGLGIMPVSGGPVTHLTPADKLFDIRSACWSPDGRRIAYVWAEKVPLPPRKPADGEPVNLQRSNDTYIERLVVADADGKNPTEILKREQKAGNIQGIDWR